MKFSIFVLAATVVLALVATLRANDWITAPSYYTHDPQSGERVRQYTPIGPFYVLARPDYRKSGYRHTRSSIQAGNSADHLHIVEEWGNAVRPYGEWRYPFRPNSVPYHLWGPPVTGFGHGYIGPWAHPYPQAGHHGRYGNMDHPGRGRPGNAHPRPWHDGRYLPHGTPRRPDSQFYRLPDDHSDASRNASPPPTDGGQKPAA